MLVIWNPKQQKILPMPFVHLEGTSFSIHLLSTSFHISFLFQVVQNVFYIIGLFKALQFISFQLHFYIIELLPPLYKMLVIATPLKLYGVETSNLYQCLKSTLKILKFIHNKRIRYLLSSYCPESFIVLQLTTSVP